jgi:hypothetical protein
MIELKEKKSSKKNQYISNISDKIVKDNFFKRKQIKRKEKRTRHGYGQPACLGMLICPFIFKKAMRRLSFYILTATGIFIKFSLRVDPTKELGPRPHGLTRVNLGK